MRRNGPTSLPADDSAIRTDADAVPTSGVRRLAIAGVSLGLAGLLCLGSPVVAFAQDAQPSTDAAP
ncbi:hypothetical protein, partial [Herbiconiux sp.]|uniref:hypothetical protein n=1 Tax=Herbiconiux sp. TaxID=1871186 RepID=UPI0025C13653